MLCPVLSSVEALALCCLQVWEGPSIVFVFLYVIQRISLMSWHHDKWYKRKLKKMSVLFLKYNILWSHQEYNYINCELILSSPEMFSDFSYLNTLLKSPIVCTFSAIISGFSPPYRDHGFCLWGLPIIIHSLRGINSWTVENEARTGQIKIKWLMRTDILNDSTNIVCKLTFSNNSYLHKYLIERTSPRLGFQHWLTALNIRTGTLLTNTPVQIPYTLESFS